MSNIVKERKHIGCTGKEDCPICPKLLLPKYAALRDMLVTGSKSTKVPTTLNAQCVHLGTATGNLVSCKSCKGNVQLKEYNCAVHGTCTLGSKSNIAGCRGCDDKKLKTITTEKTPTFVGAVTNRRDVSIDLQPKGKPNGHFNCSIIEYEGRLLLASRRGWTGTLFMSELDEAYNVLTSWKLNTKLPCTLYGSEDPRLFVFNNRLHVAFTGYESKSPRLTTQLYARFTANLDRIEQIFLPELEGRNPMEKNWTFFESGCILGSVYTVGPKHVVLSHLDNKVIQRWETTTPFRMPTHVLRGGAAPVRVGNEFYHFFHTVKRSRKGSTWGVGLYTFDINPPFAVRRWCDKVLLETTDTTHDGHKIVFPCGALLRRGQWVVSFGYQDNECRLAHFDQDEVEGLLQPLSIVDSQVALFTKIRNVCERTAGFSTQKPLRFAQYVLDHKPNLVVELGVYGGRSLISMALALQHNNQGRIVGVDPYVSQVFKGKEHSEWWDKLDLNAIRDKFLEDAVHYGVGGRCELRKQRSQDAVHDFEDGTIDILSIDGDHSEEVALADARLWFPKVRNGGLIFFDDADWHDDGSNTTRLAVTYLRNHCRVVEEIEGNIVFRKSNR